MSANKISVVTVAVGIMLCVIGYYLSTTSIGTLGNLFTIVNGTNINNLVYTTNWILIIGLVTTVGGAVSYYLTKKGGQD